MDIWAVNLNSLAESPSLWESYLAMLDEPVQSKLARFRQPADRLRSLCGEMLLRVYARDCWHLPAGGLTRTVNAYGKPALAGYSASHYNLSHAGRWVAAVFDREPVGIDVEAVLPIDMAVAKHYFSASEAEWLRQQPDERRLTQFYRQWTLKESYIKAEGKGLSLPLNSFAFQLDPGSGIRFSPPSDLTETVWHFRQYNIDPDYALSVCARQPGFPDRVETIDWTELGRRFLALF